MRKCIVIGAVFFRIVAVKKLLEKGVEDVACFKNLNGIGGYFSKFIDDVAQFNCCRFPFLLNNKI